MRGTQPLPGTRPFSSVGLEHFLGMEGVIGSNPIEGLVQSTVRFILPRAKKTTRTTLVNYIIDESGSMLGIADQVRNGFNEYIEELRETTEGEVLVTVTKFSTGERALFAAVPLADVPRLDSMNYMPSGSTALYDAVANTVIRVSDVVDKNTKVITLIMTDGEENSSIENSQKTVSALVKSKTNEGNWTFVFLGADQDAWANAQTLGIARGNTMMYSKSSHSHAMRGLAVATASASMAPSGQTASYFKDAGQSQLDYEDDPNVIPRGNTSST